jgi:hypothetical protein
MACNTCHVGKTAMKITKEVKITPTILLALSLCFLHYLISHTFVISNWKPEILKQSAAKSLRVSDGDIPYKIPCL